MTYMRDQWHLNRHDQLEARNRAVIARMFGESDDDEGEFAPNAYKLLNVAQVRARPRMRWLIEGVLPRTGCAAMYGASGSGKSFLQIDMVAAIAEGGTWFDHRIRGTSRVVLVVLEGEAGFRNRIEAWEVANQRDFPAGVKFVFQPFRLNVGSDVQALANAIQADGGTDVLVIDTLNRAAPDSDENSSRDMGNLLENSAALQRMFGGLLMLIHHSGKDQQKGMRGHSSLHAALDAEIEVRRETGGNRQWKTAKAKDGSDGAAHSFRLDVVELDEGEGGPTTSCVVRKTGDKACPHRPKVTKGGNQRPIYDALGPLLQSSPHFDKPGAPPGRPCVSFDDAVAGTKDHLVGMESKRRAERTRLAIRGLVVRADSNLSHPADRILSRGWKPTLRWPAVHKCRCLPGSSAFLSMS